jgi:hypothetical protein
MEGTDYYLYKKGLLDVVDIVKGQKYFKISKNASQGVAEGSDQQWVVTVGTKTGGTSHTMTFSGTKEQAIKQAVARFGTSKNPVVTAKPKQQGVAEANLSELNKDTVYSYAKKAHKDQDKQSTITGKAYLDNDPKTANKAHHKFSMRAAGLDRAEKRLNKEGVAEAKDPREYDYEGDMAKTQLRSIIANSQAVHDMLKDTTNLAEWVQSKITKAEDYISTVADYMTAEMSEDYVAEAKKEEDDDEDYSKNHKLDPDSGVEADQHIHVQLKKAIDSTMKPYEVSFKNGKKHSVSSPVAKTIVTAIEKLKPEHRKTVHDELHKSYDSLMGVHKAITGK